jgi:hypothetical protein
MLLPPIGPPKSFNVANSCKTLICYDNEEFADIFLGDNRARW